MTSVGASVADCSRQTLVHAGKYRIEDKLKDEDFTKTKYSPKKANNKIQQNKSSMCGCLIRHSARERGVLILQRSQAHTGHQHQWNAEHRCPVDDLTFSPDTLGISTLSRPDADCSIRFARRV